MKFAITEGKGFQITFDNGILVSVQFGSGNYCENYFKYLEPNWFYGKERQERIWSSKDAEIAVWDTKNTINGLLLMFANLLVLEIFVMMLLAMSKLIN